MIILELKILSASSVNVSWESFNTSLINGYIVYYSPTEEDGQEEQSTNVSGLKKFVIIHGLTADVEYQFQVVAVDQNNVLGERSDETIKLVTPTSAPTSNHRKFGPLSMVVVY